MMVSEPDGAHLVMHESVAHGLISEDPDQRAICSHLVRHELCHVNDYGFKLELISRNPSAARHEDFDARMAVPAFSLWDEYYANKYAFVPGSDADVSATLLEDALPPLRADVIASILRYRHHSNLEQLLAEVEPKVRFAAQCFGYLAGSLDAQERTLEVAYPAVDELLRSMGLQKAWGTCFQLLKDVDAARTNFADASGFNVLFEGIVALFAGFGLECTRISGGTYVNVPFTAETNPLLASLLPGLKPR